MKHLLFLFMFCPIISIAQTNLTFNKRFVESENKWVAFSMDKDSAYVYGFIYIDAQAGLTLNYEGKFRVTKEGVFIPSKLENTNMKYRLQPNQVKVAFIPETKFSELNIETVPAWLKSYKTDTSSVQRLYRWGFLYNSWNECIKALTYLERAQKIDPKFKGLEFELAFAYNALGQFDKAITVLDNAIKTNPNDCYLYKELTYAQIRLGQIDKAEESCKAGISSCSDKSMKSEIAYNLAQQYYKSKDKANFKRWADEVKNWATKGDQFMTNINKMEIELEK